MNNNNNEKKLNKRQEKTLRQLIRKCIAQIDYIGLDSIDEALSKYETIFTIMQENIVKE
jgi:hypothetical protein